MDKTAVKIITYFNSLEEFLIGLLFFTIPFGWTLSIVPLVLFSTTLLVNVATKPMKPTKEKLLYFLPLIAIFVWNTFSLLYSDEISHGLSCLTTQIALVVATIAFLFNKIPASSVQKGFYMFLLGCLSSVAILYGIAIYNSSSLIGDAFIFRPVFESTTGTMLDSDVSGNYFLGSTFSVFVHPAYNALMLSIAMFIILSYIKTSSTEISHRPFWLFCFTVFGITIISFSFNGTLALSAIIILLIIGILSVRKLHYGEYSRAIYSILLIFVALLLANPQLRSIAETNSSESLNQRVKVTQASFDVIGSHWLLGTGIGDDKTELLRSYERMGETELAKKKANSHNQFLTSWLQSGIIGLFILIWGFVTVSLRAQKKKVMLLHLFNVMVVVSFMFESMLLRYWGVITYTIFYGMLYFYSGDDKLEDSIIK